MSLIVGALILVSPVHGHNVDEYVSWVQAWEMAYDPAGPVAHEMLAALDDFMARHPNGPTVTPRPSTPTPAPNPAPQTVTDVEVWRDLTTAYFGDEADRALCLMGYESAGNPGARNSSSGAAGLMQVMPFWAAEYGVDYAGLFDPETNLRIAKGIRDNQGWTAWSPYNRGLCH